MKAMLAEGEQYIAGKYRAIKKNGILILACSVRGRARYISRAEALAAAGKKRWSQSAEKTLKKLIADAKKAAKIEVEKKLGAEYEKTMPVILSCGDVCALDGRVLAVIADFSA